MRSAMPLVDKAATADKVDASPVLTYLANALRSGDRQVPYSLVTAIDLKTIDPSLTPASDAIPADRHQRLDGARSRCRVGDPLTLDYYVWEEPGFLSHAVRAASSSPAIVPIAGAAADRDLAPVYPGITDAETLGDWDPPFPIDLRRVRPIDEEYWKQYRTTPKAFIPFEDGQQLWRSRYGDRTSVRIRPRQAVAGRPSRDRLTAARPARVLDPLALGFAVQDVRSTDWPRRAARPTSASTSPTSASSSWPRRCCWRRCSSGSASSSASREVGLLRAVGFTHGRASVGCSRPKGCCWRSSAASRHRRRARLRRGDDGRPADVVVGRGRDDGADASRLADRRSPPARSARPPSRCCASGGRCAGCRGCRSAACWPGI